jgi:hypothetical protein
MYEFQVKERHSSETPQQPVLAYFFLGAFISVDGHVLLQNFFVSGPAKYITTCKFKWLSRQFCLVLAEHVVPARSIATSLLQHEAGHRPVIVQPGLLVIHRAEARVLGYPNTQTRSSFGSTS